MVKSGQVCADIILCKGGTGALSTPSVGPVGTLYVNGDANGAMVLVTGANPYRWLVTLPTLAAGDLVTMYFTATIEGIATAEDVWHEVADTTYVSDGVTLLDDKLDDIQLITDRLNVMSVQQIVASSAGNFTITAGITFDESVSGLVIPSDWEVAIWTLKREVTDIDASSIVQVRKSNPSDAENDGLQILNRSATLPVDIDNDSAALTINQASGIITIYLTDDLTVLLSSANELGWDIKFIDSNGDSTGRRGTADVVLTETKAIE